MPAMAGAILRREHLVASCLVGTVVVVVGFASGLGLTRPAATAPQATQNAPTPPTSQGTQPGAPVTGGGGSAPVDYIGTPVGLAAAPIAGPQVVAVAITPTMTSSPDVPPTTSEAAPPPPPPTTTTTDAPPATCVTGLLNALLNQAGTAVNGVPVVGPLVPQLTGALVGNCSQQSTTDGPSTTQAAVPGLLPLLTPTGTGS